MAQPIRDLTPPDQGPNQQAPVQRPPLKRRSWNIEIMVGLFLLLGVGVTAVSILLLGSNDSFFQKSKYYSLRIQDASGLIPGAKVMLAGLQVGTVQTVEIDGEARDIVVKIGMQAKYGEFIRQNAFAEIATQGMLGDKFVQISPGSKDQPVIKDDGFIPLKPSRDLNQFIDKSDQLMSSLNQIAGGISQIVKTFEANGRSETLFQGMAVTAKNMASASEKFNRELEDLQLKKVTKSMQSILEKINNGTGTLGALLNDPELYDDAKALFGGANRSRLIRNLVRQTVKNNDRKRAEGAAEEARETSSTNDKDSSKQK